LSLYVEHDGRGALEADESLSANPLGGELMDQDAKKTALRMIPYGLYVLTAEI